MTLDASFIVVVCDPPPLLTQMTMTSWTIIVPDECPLEQLEPEHVMSLPPLFRSTKSAFRVAVNAKGAVKRSPATDDHFMMID
jgi:hypothetical protein